MRSRSAYSHAPLELSGVPSLMTSVLEVSDNRWLFASALFGLADRGKPCSAGNPLRSRSDPSQQEHYPRGSAPASDRLISIIFHSLYGAVGRRESKTHISDARFGFHRPTTGGRFAPRRLCGPGSDATSTTFPDSVEVVIIPDLRNPVDWYPILQGVDVIIHLAGLAHVKTFNTAYSEFDQINRIATQHLAQAVKEAGIDRFIYISSVRAQVGASAAHSVREQDEPNPSNHYGRSKLAAELAIRAAGVPFTIFRPVVVYGPHPKGNVRTLVRFARSPFPFPIASFSGRRTLLGIDNLVSAIDFALNNPVTIGETYMLADSTPMTVNEILTILRKIQGRSLTTINVPQVIIRLSLMMCGRGDLPARDRAALDAEHAARGFAFRPIIGRPSTAI